jgi:hypothetical protein
VEKPVIYTDRLVEVLAEGFKLKNYYFPFCAAKFIPFSNIRVLARKTPTLANGQWRLWGSGDLHTWFPLDWFRPRRDAIFFLTLSSQSLEIGFTVEDTEKFIGVLKSRVAVLG